MKMSAFLAVSGLLLLQTGVASAQSVEKPVSHPLQVPAGKSAKSLKPDMAELAEQPIILTLRGHRHADGSMGFSCDQDHPVFHEQADTAPQSGEQP